jgi:hypothetical protein
MDNGEKAALQAAIEAKFVGELCAILSSAEALDNWIN